MITGRDLSDLGEDESKGESQFNGESVEYAIQKVNKSHLSDFSC